MEILPHNPEFAQKTLWAVERRVQKGPLSLFGDVLCDLVESLGTLFAEATRLKQNKSVTATMLHRTDITDKTTITNDVDMDVPSQCKALLAHLTETVLMESVTAMSTSHLKRIVSVYAAIPLQVDPWIDAVEEELLYRKQQFLRYGDRKTIMSQIVANANYVREQILRQAPFENEEQNVDPARRSSDEQGAESQGDYTEYNSSTHEALDFIIAWANTLAVDKDSHGPRDACNIVLDHNRDNDCSVWLDLGRCQQLITHYRQRQSHDDHLLLQDWKETKDDPDMVGERWDAKRVISNLLP